jgi:hypothetical protein
MKALTPEQERTLALRDRYARIGVNYDKATRRFLEQHAQEDPMPTIKLLPVTINLLLEQSRQA